MSGNPATQNARAKPVVNVRPATPDDLDLILELIRDLALYERDPDAVVATIDTLHQHLFGTGVGRGPTAECLIGLVDGKPQGFAVFFHNFSTWQGRAGLYLEDLFVRPEARGCGLGRVLFAHVASIAHARGCPRLEWIVLDWNTPAIDFYKRFGAKPLDEWTVFRMTTPEITRLVTKQDEAASR